jgi:hypothetical protein
MASNRWRGHAARLASVLLAATLLAGCADGRANDAERGREADGDRDSIVTDLQATQTWNLIHGTPESTPEPE